MIWVSQIFRFGFSLVQFFFDIKVLDPFGYFTRFGSDLVLFFLFRLGSDFWIRIF